MNGTMMDYPLTLNHILERAGRLFPRVEIVSRLPDRSLHMHTYADFYRRTRALAEGLLGLGLGRGDRIATLMWNHHVHMEAYFAGWQRLRLLKSAISRSETLGGAGRCTTKVRCREPRRHQEPGV